MKSNGPAILAGLGSLMAMVSIGLPWYSGASGTLTLLSSFSGSAPICPTYYCEILPTGGPTYLIGAFFLTLTGGILGIAGTLLHMKSRKASLTVVAFALFAIIIGVLVSLSDAILREGLSVGFYTDAFSAVLFIAHIASHWSAK